MGNDIIIWNFFQKKQLTPQGIAGLMGNLYAESGLSSINLQNTFNSKLQMSDNEYTAAVDDNTYTNFVHDAAGYGLAQWTFWSRKQNLLSFAQKRQVSIGNLQMQLDFLWLELNKGYASLVRLLQTTTSIHNASNAVLFQFERPAKQDLAVQNKRYAFSQKIFNEHFKINQNFPSETKQNNMSFNPIKCFLTNSTCYKSTHTMHIKGILWHSTGANNPKLSRYVQPLSSDAKAEELFSIIGKNPTQNDWNHIEISAGVNAWIGKLANGSVGTVQAMPWNYRPWGCGSGRRGSCNDGWIQFEICEDGLNDKEYFEQVYKEACKLTAFLCTLYNIDPMGYVNFKNIQVPTILCHADSYQLGLGTNHRDVLHWFSRYGKDMNTVRQDVLALMGEEEDEDMTQERFNEMMHNYLVDLAKQQPDGWSQGARDFCERNGIINGDQYGNKMYKKFLTREELAMIVYQIYKKTNA